MDTQVQAGFQLLEAHPDAYWLLDERGALTYANRAALRLMGSPTEDLTGLSIDRLIADGPEHCEALVRQGRRATSVSPGRLRLRIHGGSELDCRCEIALVSPTNTGVPPALWCRLLPQSKGASHFTLLNQQIDALRSEVSRRKSAESEVRQKSEWLETVLLSIAEGVIATDRNGLVSLINQVAAELTGWRREEAMGRPIGEIVQLTSESNAEVTEDLLASMLHNITGDNCQSCAQLGAKGGTKHFVQASASALMSEAGHHVGTVLVLRSIDEERLAERERSALAQQLREAQKMEALGTLAGGVAHDFNNIVAAILGNVELALADTSSESESVVSLQEIRKAGRRARDLVQQILTFSRQQDNTRSATSVRALLSEAQSILRTAVPPGVELLIDAESKLPTVWANATQIEQVLLNLINNALQAVRGQVLGRVNVKLSRCEGLPPVAVPGDTDVLPVGALWPGIGVCIEVSDNGNGMTPQTLSRIFEPFFTTKATGSGTGLGLAVVHGIVREHDSSLRVRSAPGHGTSFTLWLPGMEGSEASIEPLNDDWSAISGTTPNAANAPHVLYVDDDESMVFLVKRWLERNGYRVTTCNSANQALKYLDANLSEYTLCITDYNMPGMSGLDLAREIKARWPLMLVAIASGYISEDLRQQAPSAGVDELVYKPDSVEELCRSIERLVKHLPAH